MIVETRKYSCLVLVETVLSKLSESLAVLTHRPAVVEVKTLVEKNWPSWMQGVGRYTGRQTSRDEDADTWRDTGLSRAKAA